MVLGMGGRQRTTLFYGVGGEKKQEEKSKGKEKRKKKSK